VNRQPKFGSATADGVVAGRLHAVLDPAHEIGERTLLFLHRESAMTVVPDRTPPTRART
jgi:hypothetical protein